MKPFGRRDEPLVDIETRLDALDDEPVASHPDVLEEVHRQLVAELDDLANRVARPPQRS